MEVSPGPYVIVGDRYESCTVPSWWTTDDLLVLHLCVKLKSHIFYHFADKRTFICSVRWRMCYYLFLAYFLLYAHRVNLSLAVVCMVNTQEVESTLTYSNYTATNHTHPLFKKRRGTSILTTEEVTSNDSKIMDRYMSAFDDIIVDENHTSSGDVTNSPNFVGSCLSNYETTQEVDIFLYQRKQQQLRFCFCFYPRHKLFGHRRNYGGTDLP